MTVLVSPVVIREFERAPDTVQRLFASLPFDAISLVRPSNAVLILREAYLEAGIVGRRAVDDATHVAYATVAGAHAIVSWNFRDIVRIDKMGAYNMVNVEFGFAPLVIVSPGEVHPDEFVQG